MDCKSTHFFGKYTTTLKKSGFQQDYWYETNRLSECGNWKM